MLLAIQKFSGTENNIREDRKAGPYLYICLHFGYRPLFTSL